MNTGRRSARPILMPLLIIATLTSCSDEPTAPKPEQLAGTSYSVQFDLYFSGNVLRLTGGDVLHTFDPGGSEESDLNLAFAR